METVPTTVETAVSAVVPASRTVGLSTEARAAVEEGIPAETCRGYVGDWTRFTAWCASTGKFAGGPWGYVSVAVAGCLVNQLS
ncbi:hypothetical protein ACFWOJ_38910 [Streptomyces sp. NPDC058439]|uniref:hypothetical protein n=1 Tax=Streptomyces sp. NPDC058439 TaxID=3346500 RepID=UPI003646B1E6